ncbi:unnamed protein product [Ambrosiozyma monospora]|uniref:Defect at low temperature protein 1 n=1 Tax=Ambrosiozyma monospora TaxID=43982 RepID=A0A9W7DKU6_AMBMO|nr:unnamed protein product [Ambrosiozyma monospora]
MPITSKDIPRECSIAIQNEFIRTQKVKQMAQPNLDIQHPGLFQAPNQSENADDELPNYLVYENVVRTFGEDIKYRNVLTVKNSSLKITVDKNVTLREILTKRFSPLVQQGKLEYKDSIKLQNFLKLYERLRFSGKAIEHDEFLELMQLWNQVQTLLTKFNH